MGESLLNQDPELSFTIPSTNSDDYTPGDFAASGLDILII